MPKGMRNGPHLSGKPLVTRSIRIDERTDNFFTNSKLNLSFIVRVYLKRFIEEYKLTGQIK